MSDGAKLAFDACVKTPFGAVGIVTTEAHLTGLHFLPANVSAKTPKKGSLAHEVCAQLSAYLENAEARFDIPLRLAGTQHQLDVWAYMQTIRPGQTRTYGELADAIGSSARAVGAACGQNPIPLIVPCHRIVAANGTLGGFMGGKLANPLAIKHWLLTHEGALLL
jgi:methylated-DNA-[protein]-cysteine S-methyltransferase